jgi:NAD(P)-dependent dehydrogenase (short-subunit alcohol dehydrogenase family)
MQIRLDGRVALVTGAGGVVGRASALRMASEGAHVVCADIRHENAEHTAELARNMGVRAIAICADVSDENSVRNTVQKTLEEFGHLDVLNNNAAALDPQTLGRDGDLVDMDVDVWDRTMASCWHANGHFQPCSPPAQESS